MKHIKKPNTQFQASPTRLDTEKVPIQARVKQPSPFLKPQMGNVQSQGQSRRNEGKANLQSEQQFRNNKLMAEQRPLEGNFSQQDGLESDGTYGQSYNPAASQGPVPTQDENDSRAYHNQSSAKMVRKAILDLYLNVKIRSQDEIAGMDEGAIETEKKKLAPMDTIDIIDYIKQSVEILMHMRIEEFEQFKENWNMQEKFRNAQLQNDKQQMKQQLTNPKSKHQKKESRLFEKVKMELLSSSQSSLASLQADPEKQKKLDKQAKGYEEMLIKLEADVRQHIRVEQQLKLHIEQQQQQTDDVYKDAQVKHHEMESVKKQIKIAQLELEKATKDKKDVEVKLGRIDKQHKEMMQTLQENLQKMEKGYKQRIIVLENELKSVTMLQHQSFNSEKVAQQQNNCYGMKSGNVLDNVPNTIGASPIKYGQNNTFNGKTQKNSSEDIFQQQDSNLQMNNVGNYNYTAPSLQQNKIYASGGQTDNSDSRHLKSKSVCVQQINSRSNQSSRVNTSQQFLKDGSKNPNVVQQSHSMQASVNKMNHNQQIAIHGSQSEAQNVSRQDKDVFNKSTVVQSANNFEQEMGMGMQEFELMRSQSPDIVQVKSAGLRNENKQNNPLSVRQKSGAQGKSQNNRRNISAKGASQLIQPHNTFQHNKTGINYQFGAHNTQNHLQSTDDQRRTDQSDNIHNMSLEEQANPIVAFQRPDRRSSSTHEYDHGAPKILDSGKIMNQVIGGQYDQNQVKQQKAANHQRKPGSSATEATLYNNKIIINQQHYFTDSIKIYQNDKKDKRFDPQERREQNATMQEYLQDGLQQYNFQDIINSSQKPQGSNQANTVSRGSRMRGIANVTGVNGSMNQSKGKQAGSLSGKGQASKNLNYSNDQAPNRSTRGGAGANGGILNSSLGFVARTNEQSSETVKAKALTGNAQSSRLSQQRSSKGEKRAASFKSKKAAADQGQKQANISSVNGNTRFDYNKYLQGDMPPKRGSIPFANTNCINQADFDYIQQSNNVKKQHLLHPQAHTSMGLSNVSNGSSSKVGKGSTKYKQSSINSRESSQIRISNSNNIIQHQQ